MNKYGIFFEYNITNEVPCDTQEKMQDKIHEILSHYFDLSKSLLEYIIFEEAEFFKNNVAAESIAKEKTIRLNYVTYEKIIKNEISKESLDYVMAVNILIHEYEHLINHYARLNTIQEYIYNLDISTFEKQTIEKLIDEYIASYESDKLAFSPNDVNKIIPSMCKYITKYKGKKEGDLYWQVIDNLGICFAHDAILVGKGEKSQIDEDLNCESVLEYREWIEKLKMAFSIFKINEYQKTILLLQECTSWICNFFGFNKDLLLELDQFKKIRQSL